MYKIPIDTIEQAIRLTRYGNGEEICIDRAYPCGEDLATCFALQCRSPYIPARFIGALATVNPEDAAALQQAQETTDDSDDRVVVYFPGVVVVGPIGEFDEDGEGE